VLSAGKLNLPVVPSQDYVLQDNKRCYDKILSDWNFRHPSLGFKCILVGLMNMIDGMQFWTPFSFTDIKQFLLAHGYVALTNDMLKAYKVAHCYLVKHNLVMAPKASLTYLPTTQA
jgi:hypothetical protein